MPARMPCPPLASLLSVALLLAACGASGGAPQPPADAAPVDVTSGTAPDDAPDAPDAPSPDAPSPDVAPEAAAPEAAMCAGDCGPHGHSHGDQCHCDEGYVERERCCVPAPPCTMPDDLLEENDGPTSATEVAATGASWDELRVCPADADVFRVPLTMGQQVTVRATFTHARGDLDMYLFAPRTADLGHATPLAGSDGTRDNERFTYTARATGDHLLLVTGYNGAENAYGLTVEFAGP